MKKYKIFFVLVFLIIVFVIALKLLNKNNLVEPKVFGDDNVSVTTKDPVKMEPFSSDHLRYLYDVVKKLPPTYFVGKYKSIDCPQFYGGESLFDVGVDDKSLEKINKDAGLDGDLKISKLSFSLGRFDQQKEINEKFGVLLPQHDSSHCAEVVVDARVKLGSMGLNIKEGPSSAQLLEVQSLSNPVYEVKEKLPQP